MEELPTPMRRALELAWESARAGSLGIGAVVTDTDGSIVASGRNRLAESEPGDDHLAGTSVAHAELNALAKLRWGAHGGNRLTLWTTLEPCLQCAAAIRMAPIAEVRVLAPDPLFRNVEQMREIAPHLGGQWPVYFPHPADPFAVFALLLQTHAFVFWGIDNARWMNALPRITARARALHDSGDLMALAAADTSLDDALRALWPFLTDGVDDVKELWGA
jgi:tRNA(adenine34) deaminase